MTAQTLSRRPRGRPGLLRELNEQTILDVVFRHGPLTRPEISTRSGLSKPTVSAALVDLIRSGLVVEAGQRTGTPGRVAALFAVDSKVGFVVGIDVGANRIRVAVANIYGETLFEEDHRTDRRGGERVVDQVAEAARAGVRGAEVDWQQVLAVGIATPGVIDPVARTVRLVGNIPGWDEPALFKGLEERLGTVVIIENDVNLAAVGEKWKGLGRDVDTFAFVSVGSGIGMGLILEDQLFRGVHGGAGEIAFLPLASDPFHPSHRSRGPLEDEAASQGIMHEVSMAASWNGRRPGSVEEVFALAGLGNPTAESIVRNEARRIGLAIASVCAVIDPELVILGGGIGANPMLLEPVRSVVASLSPLPPRIERTLVGDHAALYGALAVALREARSTLFSRR